MMTRPANHLTRLGCLVLLLWTAQPGRGADAADDELDGRILFERYEKNNWELYSMRADGSDLQNVTRTPNEHELYPQASPDGKQICFLVDRPVGRSTERTLWVMHRDGSGRRKLTDQARHPCWSPDGRQIALAKQEFSRFQVKDFVTRRLYFCDVETGRVSVHPNEKIEHIYVPTWTSDGKWIVATVHGGMGFGHAIVAIEVHGDRVLDLKIPGCRPSLSCDGTRITWSSDDHTVEVADVSLTDDGPLLSDRRIVYHHPTMHLYHPDLSPQGRYVTFSMGPGGRVAANGPGTHTEVAEMVGVRGMWDIYRKQVDHPGEPLQLTHQADLSNKESEWLCSP